MDFRCPFTGTLPDYEKNNQTGTPDFRTLENVQLQKNYALRIPYDKNDELGNLSDKINALLAYAEANEVHQQEYHDILPKKHS